MAQAVTVRHRALEWAGRDVTLAEIGHETARLRSQSAREDDVPDLRTSVMTHIAWVPREWLRAARATLSGLDERHPSRTILAVPDPAAARDGLDARVRLERYPAGAHQVCTEVIELRLRGRRARVPGSIVEPLLVADLPVFLRWRGRPPFGRDEFAQMLHVTDRLVVDSAEWGDPRAPLARLVDVLDGAAVSDIAWSRTLPWRLAIAKCWPEVKRTRRLHVSGPRAEALLIAGWLRSRLHRRIDLAVGQARSLREIRLDGVSVPRPERDDRSASDLLSEQLDQFGHDRIYEEALRAATRKL